MKVNCVLIFCKTMFETFLNLWRTERHMFTNVCRSAGTVPSLVCGWKENILSTDFWKKKYSNIKHQVNSFYGTRVVPWGKTDSQTDRQKWQSQQSVCAFRNFSNAPKSSQLMLHREIIAVCSQIHKKHINALCGQNVELLNVKLAVNILTTGL